MEACIVWWDGYRLHVGGISCLKMCVCACVYFLFYFLLVVPEVSSISKFEGLYYLHIGNPKGIPQ